jgi:putative transposase
MTINQQSKVPMHAVKVSADPGASQGARRATEDAPGSAPPPIAARQRFRGRCRVHGAARSPTPTSAAFCRPPTCAPSPASRRADAPRGRVLVFAEHLATPARGRRPGRTGAAKARPQGRPAARVDALHIAQLTRERDKLRVELDKAQLVIEVQKKLAALLGFWQPTTSAGTPDGRRAVELTPALGAGAACRAVGLWRGVPGRQQARWQRLTLVGPAGAAGASPSRPPAGLGTAGAAGAAGHPEQRTLRRHRAGGRARHAARRGPYLGSVRTMYRLLAASGGCRERRNQLTHPAYTKPELLAIAPNQVWSWDITKLKGPAKWTCFHLYVILDIFSRFVVGWLIAPRECSELAQQLIADTVARHDVEPGMLTLHADRGAAMRSKPVASLLVDLDVAKSHSRPHVSDDNPYSESQFKTMKYRPEFPARFGCIEDARPTVKPSSPGTTTSTATAASAT